MYNLLTRDFTANNTTTVTFVFPTTLQMSRLWHTAPAAPIAATLRLGLVSRGNVGFCWASNFHCDSRSLNAKPWTSEETATLVGAQVNGKTYAEIGQLLPGRSQGSIASKLQKLRRRSSSEDEYRSVSKPARWTKAEDDVVLDAKARGMTLRQVTELLPGKRYEQVRYRAYFVLGFNAAASGGTTSAVNNIWTPADDKALHYCRHQPGLSFAAIAKRMGGRTWNSCKSRYHRITPQEDRIKPRSSTIWTEQAVRVLKQSLASGVRHPEIAKILGTSCQVVNNKVSSIRHQGGKPDSNAPLYRRWSPEETEQLRQCYSQKVSSRDIALRLGRSINAIFSMKHLLGIRSSRKATSVTSQEPRI